MIELVTRPARRLQLGGIAFVEIDSLLLIKNRLSISARSNHPTLLSMPGYTIPIVFYMKANNTSHHPPLNHFQYPFGGSSKKIDFKF